MKLILIFFNKILDGREESCGEKCVENNRLPAPGRRWARARTIPTVAAKIGTVMPSCFACSAIKPTSV